MWARWMLVCVVLFAAGCELHLAVEATFDRNGSGRLEVALSADDALRERAAAAGADPLGDLAAAGEQLGDGWRVSDTTADGLRTVALASGFRGPAAFDALAADLAAALSAPEVELLAPLTLTLTDDRLQVEGAAGLQPTDVVAEHGLSPDAAVEALRAAGAVTYEVRVALPGEVVETNADQRDAATLTWTVAPGERVDIEAVGERPDRAWWPWAAGTAGALVLVVAAAVTVRALLQPSGRHAAR